jgi:predicted glycogen debranching enzyme
MGTGAATGALIVMLLGCVSAVRVSPRRARPFAAVAASKGSEVSVGQSDFTNDAREWLEPDGLGGFASGTVSGVRTRRYHGLLVVATTPPTGRVMLVNGFDAWIETASGRHAISTQGYGPDVRHPDGAARIEAFTIDPWPTWTYRIDDGTRVIQELFVPHEQPGVVLTWRVEAAASGSGPVRLVVRPFLSGRDYHATHHANGAVRRDARVGDGVVQWRTYEGVPTIVSRANARYDHQPDWYRNFRYLAETDRGLDDTEDLFAPGWLTWELQANAGADPSASAEAVWHLSAVAAADPIGDIVAHVARLRDGERVRRRAFASPLHRAADAYLVRRGSGKTIVAGYPWFTDWGRDTFIAMRGVCLATGRFGEARDILLEWSRVVSEGMLPNRFPDGGDAPEFNAVDASLWFVIAIRDFFDAVDRGEPAATLTPEQRATLMRAAAQILDGYARGTRYGIRMDTDGLLACGVPGVQLTWMDARVGDRVITPRIGKPVEVQALWLNALAFAARDDGRWREIYERGRAAFEQRFWCENADGGGYLYDVVDVDHQPGRVDASFRPNQIFAAGGLPVMLIDRDRARRVIDAVEQRLLTPLGLRSLAPGEPDYTPHYGGGPDQRDAGYHQGTVWPWLMGGFVDAWLAVRDNTPEISREAHHRFIAPLRAHLADAGLGHVSEIADAEPPFTPRGCPFQAWSVGELIRIEARLASIRQLEPARVGVHART